MSRASFSEDEDFQGQFALWEANLQRSMHGRAGRAALTELRDALLALPRKRLIDRRLAADGDVCTVGALLLLREAKKAGSIEAAQARLEALDAICVCSHRPNDHDERGVCVKCRKRAADRRIANETGTGYQIEPFVPNKPWVRPPYEGAYSHPYCSGWRADDDRDPDDDNDIEGEFTMALAREAGVPRMVAWQLVAQNDDSDYGFGEMDPEQRYQAVLAYVERELRASA